MEERKNLFGLKRDEIEPLVLEIGLPAYRAGQVYRWMYGHGIQRFGDMANLPRTLRNELEERFVIGRPNVASIESSRDGTVKYVFSLEDGKTIESVYIPEPPTDSGSQSLPPTRATLCLSTQVGCPLACTFCYSGTIAFARNLTVGEILGQFLGVKADREHTPPRTNVVFMGMGEPLLNTRAVLGALDVLTDPDGFSVSPRRVTVSTAGLVPEIETFVREAPKIGLAVSLHATTNALRERIMPINRKYSIEKLMDKLRQLPLPRRRKITFEYVLLGGENDSEQDALDLASLLRGTRNKVNLIAYNPWPGSPHRSSSHGATERFMEILVKKGLTVSLRRSRGDDILAACGQLAGRIPTLI
jgi:23S rRNA (adenine2503-C2)-methyltransferase